MLTVHESLGDSQTHTSSLGAIMLPAVPYHKHCGAMTVCKMASVVYECHYKNQQSIVIRTVNSPCGQQPIQYDE